MPPLGVPDEEAHFLEAYGLSNTLLGKEVKQDNYVLLDEADKDSIIYLHDISSISEWYDSFEIKKATGNIKEADMQSTVKGTVDISAVCNWNFDCETFEYSWKFTAVDGTLV